LDALPLADCLSLLRSLIGNRVDEDPRAAQELAHACCRLPLALRIAAELAANRPGTTLAGLVAELSDQQTRLDLLGADGDPRTMMRAVFSWSYRHLPEDAARAFRLAGLHPGPHWGRYAIGALANVTADEADAMIRVLTSAHLVAPIGAGRYLTHDLLRAYARDLAADRDSEADRTAALSRLFDFYLQTAASAMDVIYPGDTDRPAAPPTSIRASHAPFADEPEALDWLDAVRPALVVVATHMTESGWPGHAVRLAGIVWRYLDSGGHFPEAVAIHIQALRAARDTGNRGAEGTALLRLGVIDYRQGRYESATNHLKQALPLFSGGGDQNFEARTMSNLGLIELQQGRHDQAADYLQRSLVLFRECDDRKSEAFTVCNLGMIDLRQGRHDQAATRLEQSRAWFHKHGDRVTSAYALLILGELDLRQGRYGQAGERIQEALAIWRETGYRSGEADALTLLGTLDGRQNRYDRADERLREALDLCTEIGQPSVEANVLASLGLIELARGRHALAGERLQQALDLFREIGDLTGECTALNGLGEVFFATGHPDQAAIWHSDALRLADQAGLLYEEARAHDGIGNACDALGETSRSRSHWERALSLYTELGTPEAEQVRARFPLRD
jgi:tetratricopeptide (TPR) repeat protein